MDKKRHIVAVTAFIRNLKGDKFLIIKRSMDEIAYPGKWGFVGGKLEAGETIMDTLKREVLEEVGLEIEDHKEYLYDYTFGRPDEFNVVGICFEVKPKSEDVVIEKDLDDFAWITKKEFKNYDTIEGMDKQLKLIFKEEP